MERQNSLEDILNLRNSMHLIEARQVLVSTNVQVEYTFAIGVVYLVFILQYYYELITLFDCSIKKIVIWKRYNK